MPSHTISVVLPYYNEKDFIRATLESCLAQTRLPDELILVDNNSTDGSERVCRETLDDARGMTVKYIHEKHPGAVAAMQAGFAHAECDFTAIWNADTIYPPHYFALAHQLLDACPDDVMALMARDVYGDPDTLKNRAVRHGYHWLSRWRTRQPYTGGFGQIIRTWALRSCGGYSKSLWNYAMDDHEFIHRLCKHGVLRTHPDLWCTPSTRRADRSAVSWNLFERIVYFLTPYSRGDWFWYRFLSPRFERRKLVQANLREKSWEKPASAVPPPHIAPAPAKVAASAARKPG